MKDQPPDGVAVPSIYETKKMAEPKTCHRSNAIKYQMIRQLNGKSSRTKEVDMATLPSTGVSVPISCSSGNHSTFASKMKQKWRKLWRKTFFEPFYLLRSFCFQAFNPIQLNNASVCVVSVSDKIQKKKWQKKLFGLVTVCVRAIYHGPPPPLLGVFIELNFFKKLKSISFHILWHSGRTFWHNFSILPTKKKWHT